MHRGEIASPKKSNGSFPNPQQKRLGSSSLSSPPPLGQRDRPKISTYEGPEPAKGHIVAHPARNWARVPKTPLSGSN